MFFSVEHKGSLNDSEIEDGRPPSEVGRVLLPEIKYPPFWQIQVYDTSNSCKLLIRVLADFGLAAK